MITLKTICLLTLKYDKVFLLLLIVTLFMLGTSLSLPWRKQDIN
ncbi:hypothetical protein JOD18_001475 [Gracilibacillus alcaliphilus]|nr:hypothetical protein [Gracilibacillus alcaliphilus]